METQKQKEVTETKQYNELIKSLNKKYVVIEKEQYDEVIKVIAILNEKIDLVYNKTNILDNEINDLYSEMEKIEKKNGMLPGN